MGLACGWFGLGMELLGRDTEPWGSHMPHLLCPCCCRHLCRWIHVAPFQQNTPKGCKDDDEKCEEWAILGECERQLLLLLACCWPARTHTSTLGCVLVCWGACVGAGCCASAGPAASHLKQAHTVAEAGHK